MSSGTVQLRCRSVDALMRVLLAQLNSLCPAEEDRGDGDSLASGIPRALERMRPILAAVRAFTPDVFDHLHSLQYASFLYLLANEIKNSGSSADLPDRLFCLNRALNAIDLFYAVRMPEVFFLSHGLGAVLGNASYGDRLVVFQGVTVGRVGDRRPSVGSGVIMYPGATVTGASVIGDRSVLSSHCIIHNVSVPPDVIVTVQGGELCFKPRTKDYLALYLRP